MALPASLVGGSHPHGGTGHNLVHGPDSPLVDTRRTCARVALSDATVLLTGETGTGKEVFARFIHTTSPRSGRPFVPVNCGAIPETLIESELFGYVRGAFTGAVNARRGRVAMAEGGTLFLDEIGELPLALQVKLLRLLQERSYEPVGSSESVMASFRLIAATNRDLAEEVRAGRFRSDLFYRLHVCPVRLPSLRERRGDIPHLFRHFWTARGETRTVEATVMQCLTSYDWPGNVRELENLVERVSVCAEGDVIRLMDVPLGIRAPLDGELEAAGERGRAKALDVSYVEEGNIPADLLAPTASPSETAGAVLPSAVSDVAVLATAALAPSPEAIAPPPPDGPTIVSLKSLASMASELREAVRTEAGSAGQPTGYTPTPIMQFPIDLPTMLRDLENRYINAALAHTGSNKKEAAKLLGMGRTTLVEKLRRRSDARPGASEPDGVPVVGPDPD
jgi:sigma-54 dependent transcriptional regulator, flagellar regulatory protein